ncbi:EpsG family protein, partial [Vibrio breoganii]
NKYSYYRDIKEFLYLSKYVHGEIGFLLFLSMLKEFGLSFNYFYFFNSLVSLIILFYCLNKVSKNVLPSFIYYFFNYFVLLQFVQVRTGMIVSLFLFFIVFHQSKPIKSYLVIFAGILYQKMIGAVVIIPLLSRISLKNWSIVVFFIASSSYVINVFDYLSLLPFSGLSTQVDSYVLKEAYSGTLPLFATLYSIVVFIIYWYMVRYIDDDKDKNMIIFCLKIYLLGVMCLIVFRDVTVISNRLYLMFTATILVIIPLYFKHVRLNIYYGLFLLFLYIYPLYKMFKTVLNPTLKLLPYSQVVL